MFPNQFRFGKDIADVLLDPSIVSVLAMALTQSGKTGSMLAVIQQVPHDHVFIITGLSSVDWMTQTRQRFPPKYHDSIFHRNQLPQFVRKVKHLKNVLIIIDENQIAFKESQSIHLAFQQANLMKLDDLKRKRVRVVHFTATPTNTAAFLKNEFSRVVMMRPEPAYVSAFDLLDQNRILEYKNLCGTLRDHDYTGVDWTVPESFVEVDRQVFQNIEEIRPFLHEPKYHIIRTGHSFYHDVTILNFRLVFPDAIMLSDPDMDILDHKPEQHTFLFIKEKLRCAKTLNKLHLGILYERITHKPVMDTILQGLVGRLTGYHHNSHSVVFSNPALVELYRSHWLLQFSQYKSLPSIFIGSSF
jgi:hypothetical protein